MRLDVAAIEVHGLNKHLSGHVYALLKWHGRGATLEVGGGGSSVKIKSKIKSKIQSKIKSPVQS